MSTTIMSTTENILYESTATTALADAVMEAVSTGVCLRAAHLGGANLRGADLRGANLRAANLRGADLREADLRDADLGNADLRAADVRAADLRGAYLRAAEVSKADLRGADLRAADLSEANLSNADLRCAYLRDHNANLRDADLGNADLRGAYLSGADLPAADAARLRILPDHGDVTGWKRARDNRIIELRIPHGTPRSNATSRQCRAASAVVVAITDLAGTTRHETAVSIWDRKFVYRAGETVTPTNGFEEDPWVECGAGIHFFITRAEAEHHL